MQKIRDIFLHFYHFSFNFISPFTYSVLGQAKSDMILGIFENNYSSTYKALEMIFTNPFLQVFYA